MSTITEAGLKIAVPRHLLSSASATDHFVLRAVGDGMRGEGICNGDFLVVLRRDRAQPGELAIVQIGDESTLRYWCPLSDGMVMLESETQKPICVHETDCMILGIPVGVMRKFKPRRTEP